MRDNALGTISSHLVLLHISQKFLSEFRIFVQVAQG